MFRLTRHFSLMSAITMAAITAALVAGYHWTQTRDLHRHAADRNASLARLIAATIWSDHYGVVADARLHPSDALADRPEVVRLDLHMRSLTQGLDVLKVKLFAPDGLTVYSSEKSQIGESKASNADFRHFMASNRPLSNSSFRDRFTSFDGIKENRWLIETYVPIESPMGGLAGVVEVYSDITEYALQIRRTSWSVAAFGVLVLGLLYVLLLLIVRRADAILVEQYARLARFNEDLERGVAERTRALLNQQDVLSWITKSDEFRQGSIAVAARSMVRAAAGVLGAERASVWLLDDDRASLTLVEAYQTGEAPAVRVDRLDIDRLRGFITALEQAECIATSDAVTDPRTSELADSYLRPQGVRAMLAASIGHKGRIEGVVVVERLGPSKPWPAEQQLFAASLANLVEIVLERTDREAAEAGLKAANQSVEAANRAKSLFLANMSHEIRTPMNGVFGMTDLLLRTELGERQRRLAHTIQRSARNLLTIINDILDISRIETGKLMLDRHEFNLRHVIEETVELLSEEAERKELELSLFVASEAPTSFVGDAGRVRQIATNIISNAIKFTRQGGVRVRIEAERAADGRTVVVLSVADTGLGIPPEVQARLFQPFEQADSSITRRFGGTGLGLSISRHLVEMMGGSIGLESEPEKGTTVTVRIPGERGAAAAASDRPSRAIIAGKRILILDDRETNREIVATYLEEYGAVTTQAGRPEEALGLLRRAAREGEPYALAVIDMVLPGTTGLELGRHIMAEPSMGGTRLVMLTSMSWKGDTRMAREQGFQAFLSKPVRRAELIDTVCRVLAPADAATGTTAVAVATRRRLEARVLLAEDNPVNLEVAREYLENLGCRITIAVNGVEACEQFAKHRFDAALIDCQMPEMDGLTATRRMRAQEERTGQPHTPIIAVTANAFEEDRVACLAAGMDDYIRKPFTEEMLEMSLSRWLRPRQEGRTAAPAGAPAGAPAATVAASADAEAAATATAATLDHEQLARMRKSHGKLLERLITTYLSYAPGAVARLASDLALADMKALSTGAHSLKSSSANVGATLLASLCRDLELLGKAPAATIDERCRRLVADITAEYALVEVALGKERALPVATPAPATGAGR